MGGVWRRECCRLSRDIVDPPERNDVAYQPGGNQQYPSLAEKNALMTDPFQTERKR